jgi:hypothetical protein
MVSSLLSSILEKSLIDLLYVLGSKISIVPRYREIKWNCRNATSYDLKVSVRATPVIHLLLADGRFHAVSGYSITAINPQPLGSNNDGE